MKKRYAVLGLSVVLALALAVPALGGPTNPVASISASAKSIANKALKKAKSAQETANSALNAANSAQSDANKAQTTATNAQKTASGAQGVAQNALNTANAAKTAATNAGAAAAAAEANANTRVKDSHEAIGAATGPNTVTSKSASADCPSTEPVLGGGFFVGGESNKVTITSSDAQLYGHGWITGASVINGQGTPEWSLSAVVMCGSK
jgi:hypothetical protein